MKPLQFNLNDYVHVKLKEDGFIHYMFKHNEWLPLYMKRPIEHFKSKADKEGYVKFHMWEFMQMFGETINMGEIPIFETDIKVEVNQHETVTA